LDFERKDMSHDMKNDDPRFESGKAIGTDTPIVDAHTWNASAFGPHAPVCVLETAQILERENKELKQSMKVIRDACTIRTEGGYIFTELLELPMTKDEIKALHAAFRLLKGTANAPAGGPIFTELAGIASEQR
jgi:hypothetical protein